MSVNTIIDKFMPSEEMRKFLKSSDIVDMMDILNIVTDSPACDIWDKLKTIKELKHINNGSFCNEFRSKHYVEYCDGYINYFQRCIDLLYTDGIFSLEMGNYDDILNGEVEKLESLHITLEDVKEEIATYDLEDDDLIWFTVSKWILKDGKYDIVSDYIFIKGKIIFSNLYDDKNIDYPSYNPTFPQLNIPVTFKQGDIVEIDGYPFHPPYLAIILTKGDNIDCCCIEALAYDENAGWKAGALKHGGLLQYQDYQISPIYSLKYFDGELTDDTKLLLKIQKIINGSEGMGEFVFSRTSVFYDPCTEEEILETLKEEMSEDEKRYCKWKDDMFKGTYIYNEETEKSRNKVLDDYIENVFKSPKLLKYGRNGNKIPRYKRQ